MVETSEWVRNVAAFEASHGAETVRTQTCPGKEGGEDPGRTASAKAQGCEQESKGRVLKQRARGQGWETKLERQG